MSKSELVRVVLRTRARWHENWRLRRGARWAYSLKSIICIFLGRIREGSACEDAQWEWGWCDCGHAWEQHSPRGRRSWGNTHQSAWTWLPGKCLRYDCRRCILFTHCRGSWDTEDVIDGVGVTPAQQWYIPGEPTTWDWFEVGVGRGIVRGWHVHAYDTGT